MKSISAAKGTASGDRTTSPTFILGQSGFIGSHLKARLQATRTLRPLDGCSLNELDLAREGAWEELASRLTSDTRLVVLAGVKRQLGDSFGAFETNMRIAVSVARAIEKSRPARVVFFSSAAVYGEEIHNTAINEETVVNPVSYYGIAKFASERLLANAAGPGGLSLVLLRPPLIYGPGDTSISYGPAALCRAAALSEPTTLWGDGTELREFLYVQDACRLVEALLDSKFEGVLNAVSGTSHTFREVISSIEKISGNKINTVEKRRTKAKVDNAFEANLLRSVLPDFRFSKLEEGLRMTYQSCQNHE